MESVVRASAGEPGIPAGFPILFDAEIAIIEPAFVWLMQHAELSGRAPASETVRTDGEHLHDWFDALGQSGIDWREADERVIAAYRNRMLETPRAHQAKLSDDELRVIVLMEARAKPRLRNVDGLWLMVSAMPMPSM